jgi:DUF971 family protein
MSIWPTTIKKIDSGKNLLIKFENNDEFTVSAELLRVECPSADVQGHGGPKIIVRNKSDVVISSIEQIGNYAIRIIFSDNHSSGLFSWDLLHDYGKNHDLYLNKYYKSLNLI